MIPRDLKAPGRETPERWVQGAPPSPAERVKRSRILPEQGEVEHARMELTGALAALGGLAAVPVSVQVVDVTLLNELNLIARMEGEQSRFDSMAVTASCAARIAQQWGCAHQEAQATHLCATAANFTDHLSEAAGLLRRAADVFAAAGDTSGLAKRLNNLGTLLTTLGEHPEALTVLFQCHQLLNQCASPEPAVSSPVRGTGGAG